LVQALSIGLFSVNTAIEGAEAGQQFYFVLENIANVVRGNK